MKNFNGKVLFLDRSDINTDEIIPAKYLTELTKDALKPYLLEDLDIENFNPKTDTLNKAVIVTRENFGCGSSREHAPWSLEVNGINLVIAENFARIFRQNMFNCGMIATELSKEEIDNLFNTFAGTDTDMTMDYENRELTFSNNKDSVKVSFTLDGFEDALVKAGGWVEFADKNY